MIFSPVSALVIGAPGSEWILLPKQAAAFWEGHKKSSALFQKICWEEPEKQKTRSCRAQELSEAVPNGEGEAGQMHRSEFIRCIGEKRGQYCPPTALLPQVSLCGCSA